MRNSQIRPVRRHSIPFEEFWNRLVIFLQQKLNEKQGPNGQLRLVIDNWTVDGKWRRETIPILAVSQYDVICETEQGDSITAHRQDFETVYEVWDEYVKGELPRSEIRNRCAKTVFCIAIIHYLEEQGLLH